MAQALHFVISSSQSSSVSLSKLSLSKPSQSLPYRLIPVISTRKPISAMSSDQDSSSHKVLVSENGKGGVLPAALPPQAKASTDSSAIEVDAVSEAELKENGFRSTRRTKLVCTIGPASCGFEQLEALAVGGMNVARSHVPRNARVAPRRDRAGEEAE